MQKHPAKKGAYRRWGWCSWDEDKGWFENLKIWKFDRQQIENRWSCKWSFLQPQNEQLIHLNFIKIHYAFIWNQVFDSLNFSQHGRVEWWDDVGSILGHLASTLLPPPGFRVVGTPLNPWCNILLGESIHRLMNQLGISVAWSRRISTLVIRFEILKFQPWILGGVINSNGDHSK